MSAIVSSCFQVNSTPFCDKDFKGVRVCGQFLGGTVYAVGLLIASVVCRIFNRGLSSTYYSMAKFEVKRGGVTLVSYLKFGKALIDFSYNGCVIAPPSDTEKNALRARYGTEAIDRWLQIGTEKIPLKTQKLARKETGICMGMSLDFMKQYLQKIEEGVSSLEAVREISSRYVNGAPDEAQIAQVFYGALDSIHVSEQECSQFDALLQEKIAEALQWAEDELQQAEALRCREIESAFHERLKNLRLEYFSKMVLAIAQIKAQHNKIAAKQFGLRMGAPQVYAREKISQKCDAEFADFLENLPDDCYVGGLHFEGGAHIISLIKANDAYFLFDPNFGTLAFDKDIIAEKLWEIAKDFYFKNKYCSLIFSPCTLR